jgi:hypothetical protein
VGYSVLIDNSILSYGKFARPITVPVPGFGNRLALIEALRRRPDDQAWLREQIEALPTIAKAARDPNLLQLCSYFELEMEDWRGGNFPEMVAGNVFHGIPIEQVNHSIKRSLFVGTSGVEIASVDAQLKFCQWLLANGTDLLEKPGSHERLGTVQIDILRQLDRYREICKSLAPKHYVDALHLWTGELNSLQYFLTTDATFVRALQNNKRLKLICSPIFPDDLVSELGITDREPMPYAYGRRYQLNGTPYE